MRSDPVFPESASARAKDAAPMTRGPLLHADLPPDVARERDEILRDWRSADKTRRLWSRDATLWTGRDESEWLGWLSIVERQRRDIARIEAAENAAYRDGVADVVVLGMGGSSLCADVFAHSFSPRPACFPRLSVLDSTDPAQLLALEGRIDLDRTCFVVASKSGGTLEPNLFQDYFFERVATRRGKRAAGGQFVAITDPQSSMERVARERGFASIFFGDKTIGGRYSALSDFGLVPAAMAGLNVRVLLDRAAAMACACGPAADPSRNPGVALGALLGAAARCGRDKVTIVSSRGIERLGAWLEQLLAESTGKQGKALIPVDGEALADPSRYGADRLFLSLRLRNTADETAEARLDALKAAGHPVVEIVLSDRLDLAAEFFRWEFATAVAGSVLGIHPFDQPDVEAAKIATKSLTAAFEEKGAFPKETPLLVDGELRVFSDETNAARTAAAAGGDRSLVGLLRAHLRSARKGDYVALLAFVEMSEKHEALLQRSRHAIRDSLRVATCLGFGPRFLHSTGQAYKGGPNTGVFLEVTCDDAVDVPVPGRRATFGVVKAAQARGDFAVLCERGRRVLRVHLGKDVAAGLSTLADAIRAAM